MKTRCGNVTGNLLLMNKYKHNTAGPDAIAIRALAIFHPQKNQTKTFFDLGPNATFTNMRMSNF